MLKGEVEYLNLIKELLIDGNSRDDRTGVGTLSKFGTLIKFSLKDNIFPLLTTKRMFLRGIVEELLWFISGSTDSMKLSEKGVKIWDYNGSREFLDKCGFKDRRIGDLGPIYSHSWRHFGAEYKDSDTDYTGQGIDQLQNAINLIKSNPTNRRIIVNSWNAKDLHLMVLPPCHLQFQFYVSNDNKYLSCKMDMRSCDIGLGLPFNIASYTILTIMIAHITGLEPLELIITLGDYHIYNNHIQALTEQVSREPKRFPKLKIKRKVENIDDFRVEDFELENYDPYPAITMQLN